MTAPTQPKSGLPTTLQWYRDAANWVVGLSAGAVAAGIAYRGDILGGDRIARYVFVLGGAGFLLAIFAGIQFYFWITTYANQRERQHRLTSELNAAQNRGDNSRFVALQTEMTRAEEKIGRSQQRYGYFYTLLLWAFHIGLVAYGVSTLWLILRPTEAIQATERWSVVTIPCCAAARCRLPQPHVLRIEESSGLTWYLATDSTRLVVWKPVLVDSTVKGT